MTLPRFYPILDTSLLMRAGVPPEDAARAVIDAGAKIVQFRHKETFDRAAFAQAEQVAGLCREAGVGFILNDRADIAVLLDAGLHVGQEDLPPSAARELIGARTLGYSTHNRQQLEAAASEPADYLAIGPIYETASKRNPDPVVGTAELSRLRDRTCLPLVAIGGVSLENCREVLDAGADSVAVIGDLVKDGCRPDRIARRAGLWVKVTNG